MLIDPTLEAKSVTVSLREYSTLQVRGTLEADEVIPIEIPDGAGGWKSLTEGGTVIQLDADNEQLFTKGRTLVRVNKPITDAAVGVAKIG